VIYRSFDSCQCDWLLLPASVRLFYDEQILYFSANVTYLGSKMRRIRGEITGKTLSKTLSFFLSLHR